MGRVRAVSGFEKPSLDRRIGEMQLSCTRMAGLASHPFLL